ncbi:MAG: citramalate synthase [Actinobacteria bacterium]|nr:MAG: citramalate synthase [Actinomycetota bacterium]
MSKNQVFLYDTTLRDGAQREGLSFTVQDKLKIAKQIDKLGIHYIEGGMPAANPKDAEFFREAKKLKLKHSKLVAFGSTRYKGVIASKDKSLKAIVNSGVKVACIFGKSWPIHVRKVLKTSLKENLAMISDSVKYLKNQGLEVIYDAEHFFDAYKSDSDYALKTLEAAEVGGADFLVLCDTNGGALPHEVDEIVKIVSNKHKTPLGIHAHNDSESAVANSLIAVRSGVSQVQGTINGYGERCGNANLMSVIPALALKMNKKAITNSRLRLLTETAHYVSEIVNVTPDAHQPYVGQSAFAHKAGLHVSAVSKDKDFYQHIDPSLVGNASRVLISELAGKSNVVIRAKHLGIDLSKEPRKVEKILKKIKELEYIGYHFEAADGSFEVMIKKYLKKYKPLFRLESFRVLMEKRKDTEVLTEATIKVHCKGKRIVATAEGNGPVNALDTALRMAIGKAYPSLKKINLSDYKVRVLDEKKGTGAVVRVLIESSDGKESWGTIGVSENIIEASWQALVDSLDYGLKGK